MQYAGGRFYDLLLFGMTHEEFEQQHGGSLAEEASPPSQ
jgi:hypothetical protein